MINWDAIGAIGEVVGAGAVVITLVYLALQVRENSRQLRLTSTLSINSLMNEGFDPIYNNEENMRIWTTGLEDPDALQASDLEIFWLFFTRLMNPYETIVTHHRLGAIDDEQFDRYTDFFADLINTPGGQSWSRHGQIPLARGSRKNLGI